MTRRLALLALVLAVLGCDRYRTRAQGPFADRKPTGPAPTTLSGVPASPKPPLAINTPTNPHPPAPPGGSPAVPPVPPRPSEPAATAVTPPQPVRPPTVVEKTDVVPAGGVPPVAAAGPVTPAAGTVPASPANTNLTQLQRLVYVASQKWKTVDTFEARLTRREAMGDKPAQTEEVLFQFRKEPMAVYMKNVGEVGQGREVLYNPAKFEDKIHVIIGKGEGKLMYKDGTRGPSLTPDSPMVRSRSRKSIREAGFGSTIGKFAGMVAAVQAGKLPADTLKYAGTVKRPEYGELPLDAVEQIVRAGEEPDINRGGVRQWFFDAKPDSTSYGLPVLVILLEAGQPAREVEYYCFTQFRLPAYLTDANFDPARLKTK